MQDKKEYIIEKSFKIFIMKGYDSVSMTILHKELGISRGAMYRYFESKDALFIAVVDRFLSALRNTIESESKEDLSVRQKIDHAYECSLRIGKYLDNIEDMQNIHFLNFSGLLIQAVKIYPGFIDIVKDYKKKTLKEWKKAVESGIANGELRADVDPDIASRFFAKMGTFTDPDELTKSFEKAIKQGKKVVDYFYSLIKA